jgi:hypothetical protein
LVLLVAFRNAPVHTGTTCKNGLNFTTRGFLQYLIKALVAMTEDQLLPKIVNRFLAMAASIDAGLIRESSA